MRYRGGEGQVSQVKGWIGENTGERRTDEGIDR